VEGNALPAHLVSWFSAFGSHAVALGLISLLLCMFLIVVYRSQHPRVVAYRPLLMLHHRRSRAIRLCLLQ
jgi:hypothetical protein